MPSGKSAMIEVWTVQLFGTLCARQGEHTLTRFRTHKTGALLAYLAFHADRPHPREVLSELFWPDSEEGAGLHSLRMALTSLRRQLEPPGVPGGAVLRANRRAVQLNPASFTTDVAVFENALLQAAQSDPGARRAEYLAQAVDLYQGELLSGYYDPWILPQVLRLEERYFGAVEELLLLLESTGQTEQALEFAGKAVAIDPKREDSRLALIRVAMKARRADLARRHCQEYVQLLAQEQDCPSPAYYRICQQLGVLETGLVSPMKRQTVSPSPTLSSSLYKAALRQQSVAPLWQPPHLPAALSRFFGREEELARLQALLLSSPSPPRLLTLMGAGGSGKTRLALQLAERIQVTFYQSVWFVPLADILEARLIPETILKAMRLPRLPGIDPLEQATASLAQQPALLILDNFEHLVEEGAAIIGDLLQNAPAVTCLVTSRQPLEWVGEQTFPVGPLPLPEHTLPLERLSEFACVQLFVDRAQEVQPDFQLTRNNARAVIKLCRRLEGIPLALELAAARVLVLSPAQMLAQLYDRFALLVTSRRNVSPRHRSLWATLEWSYDLLPPTLKPFFLALSVFRGGWSAEAAASVYQQADSLEILAQVRRRSLITTEEQGEVVRFRMLETVREFAAARLSAEESAVLAQVHADYYLELAEQAARSWMGSGEKEWMDRLEIENNNLRAALDWYEITEEIEKGLRLAGALWRFWLTRTYLEEGRKRLEILLAQSAPQASTAERAGALIQCGVLVYAQCDFSTAQAYLETGLEISRKLGDEANIAFALNSLGMVFTQQLKTEAAQALHEEALEIRRRLCDKAGIAASLSNMGYLFRRQQSYQRAQQCFEESLSLRQELGDEVGRADSFCGLGEVAWIQYAPDKAKPYWRESLTLSVRMENYRVVVKLLESFGILAVAQGDAIRAARLVGAASALRTVLGLSESSNSASIREKQFAQAHEQLGEEAFQAAYEMGKTLTLEEAVAEAMQV